jgi:hypothetical protein
MRMPFKRGIILFIILLVYIIYKNGGKKTPLSLAEGMNCHA